MKLFSVCLACDAMQDFDGDRRWGDVDKCQKCGETMDIYTEAGVRNENNRRWFGGLSALKAPPR